MSTDEWPNGPMKPHERSMLRFLGWLWAGLCALATLVDAFNNGGHTVAVYAFGGMALVVLLLLTISRPRSGGTR